jgi:hypothetical protein
VSYEMELAAQRAAERLRGIARAESGERPTLAESGERPTLAEWLEEIAASLEAPLAAVRRVRQREAEREEWLRKQQGV